MHTAGTASPRRHSGQSSPIFLESKNLRRKLYLRTSERQMDAMSAMGHCVLKEGEAVQCGGEEGGTLTCLAALNHCVCHSSPCPDFNLNISVFN